MGSQTLACLIRLTLHFIAARLPDPPLSARKATKREAKHITENARPLFLTHNRHIRQLTATFDGIGPLSIILFNKATYHLSTHCLG